MQINFVVVISIISFIVLMILISGIIKASKHMSAMRDQVYDALQNNDIQHGKISLSSVTNNKNYSFNIKADNGYKETITMNNKNFYESEMNVFDIFNSKEYIECSIVINNGRICYMAVDTDASILDTHRDDEERKLLIKYDPYLVDTHIRGIS